MVAITVWRAIAGFDGKYEVSNHGQVRSYLYKTRRPLKPCLVGGRKKYQSVSLRRAGKTERAFVHHLVMETFGTPKPGEGYRVEFHDRDPSNCSISNLAWVKQGGA